MIAIIDYQMGNLRSVQKAFEKAGFEATITSDPETVAVPANNPFGGNKPPANNPFAPGNNGGNAPPANNPFAPGNNAGGNAAPKNPFQN